MYQVRGNQQRASAEIMFLETLSMITSLTPDSVMQVIEGIGDVVDVILAPLNVIIDAIVDAAPSFSLPGGRRLFIYR